jgi:hypothetical protein
MARLTAEEDMIVFDCWMDGRTPQLLTMPGARTRDRGEPSRVNQVYSVVFERSHFLTTAMIPRISA